MSGIQLGVYDWSYSGGRFDVALRPNGVFYCSKYPTKAAWRVADNKLTVEFGKYGNYEFTLPAGSDGSIDGKALDNSANWRKLTFKREFNPTETLLLGEHGYGSVWNFEYAKGGFEIEFRCDAYNHFVCKTYPSHSHWLNTDDGLVQIFWGKYGDYELRLDPSTPNQLVGSKSGQASNWRKAQRLRSLDESCLHEHDHSHEHDH